MSRILRQSITTIVLIGLGLGLFGCREAGNNVSGGFGSLGAPGASANRGLGLLLYNVYRTGLDRDGDSLGMYTLETHRVEFIDAVNAIIPADVSQNLYGTITDLLPLIDDGTIPGMADDAKLILQRLKQNDEVLEALVNLQDLDAEANGEDYVKLLSRLLAYPEFDPLVDAIATLIEENDGEDGNGQPNGERDLLSELVDLLSRTLRDLPDLPAGSNASSKLADVLLTVTEQRDGVALGEASWCVRIDEDGFPQVRKGANGDFLPPFVDLNNDGKIDTNGSDPVDSAGQVIDLAPFGTTGQRDAYSRAVTAQSELIYEYFDAKETVVASVLRVVGDVLRDDIHKDFLAIADGMADRNPAGGFSDDNPTLDVMFALLEMFKGEPSANTLRGAAALLNDDPDLAESIMVDLGDMVSILRSTTIAQTTTTSTSGSQMDLLIPLLDEALEHNGQTQSAARELLQAFSTEQQRLGNLPQGFALMMRYHNYGQQVLTGPGKPSAMESVLDMVREADQCNNPLGGGTLAELYMDTVGGNGSILGISISISTMNLITTYLGQFLCGGLTSQHIAALQDFDDTGALDAFTPIAKVFSDRGETRLLVDIMVAMGDGYASAMRPLEPAIVDVLESGAVDSFFDAFDKMNQVQIPGTNDVVSDAIADALSVLVDDDSTVLDRHGNAKMSLAHLLFDALEDMTDRLEVRSLDDESEHMLDFVLDIATATVTNSQGTKVLKHSWLIPLTAATMDELADSLPTNNAQRIADVEELQQDLIDFQTGTDYELLIDVLLTIDNSTVSQDIYDAVANLVTPQVSVAEDVYGALLPLLCSALNTRSNADPNDMIKLLRFVGEILDPNLHLVDNLIDGTQALLAQDDGRTVLTIVRNAFFMGPNGTDMAPIEILVDILEDVSGSSSLPGSGPVTVTSLKTDIQEIVDFIEDDVHGLQQIFDQLRNRTY